MARRPTRPTPEPLDVDAVSVVTAGTVLWGIGAIVLALFGRNWLDRHDDTWWIWTCVAGFLLGLVGIAFVRRRRSRLGRVAAARAEQPPGAPPADSVAAVVDPVGPAASSADGVETHRSEPA
ncbi:DUF2530 domain-containing protein [Cryptosporangium aurantiacum]|uniref:DUF2530 domain-containing protein n=1 Tax=Cryptosporangium aurantiacum TaxID=134849 RepID=A0A1M7MZ73_9ACTN|nr:DUF2530 domain-containing protein [Cryptosporangium aurantiacum]SHM96526.1 Protein of unknown function [Cryptosporangium aurantiacum]